MKCALLAIGSVLVGWSGCLAVVHFRIRRLLLSLTEGGGGSPSPSEIEERIKEEIKDDEKRDEIIERLKKILEENQE